MKELLVLVIENDTNIRTKIRHLLLSENYLLLEADTLKRGLDFFHHGEPDLVILDQELEELRSEDGSKLEAAIQKIKETDRSMPILLLANHCPQDLFLNLFRFERMFWSHKPLESKEFLESIKIVLDFPLVNPIHHLRSALRIQTELPIEIADFGPALIQNLSSTGAFIKTDATIQKGTQLTLFINIPNETLVTCKVVWTREKNPKLRHEAGIGIEFINVDSKKKNTLTHYLTQEVLKEKRFSSLIKITSLSSLKNADRTMTMH